MKYRLAIFDFDGTLADSFPFFIGVINSLAERHGFRQVDPDLVPLLRGYSPGRLMKYVGLPSWKLPLVAKDFMSLMRENIAAIRPFEGVGEVLSHLKERGVTLAVVSSNSYENVSAVLGPENTRLFSHFECGMSIFGKASRIGKTLNKTAIPGRDAIYIGDQITDLTASRKAGVAFGAVSWGYGTIESLREQAPEEEFDCVSGIKRIA